MTNDKHGLRHDADGVLVINRQMVIDRIPFLPEWVEDEGPCAGLPTKVGAWIKQNLEVGHSVVGVRWLNWHPYFFMLTRFENSFRAQFKMPDKRMMSVTPGVIEISQYEPSNQLLIRYNEFRVEGGTTWKAWFETKRRYDYNYHDCPQTLDVALSLIDNLLYEITKVPNKQMGAVIRSLVKSDEQKDGINLVNGPAYVPRVPAHLAGLFTHHRSYVGDIETPVEIEKFFHFTATCYYSATDRRLPHRSSSPDENLYAFYQSALIAFLQGKEADLATLLKSE